MRRAIYHNQPNPNVALILNNIGTLLVHQNCLTEAKTYFMQAIEIMQALLGGVNTPHTLAATGLWGLAYIEKEQGDFDQARIHYELCLNMNLKLLGEHNPLTIKNRKLLASIEKRRATISNLPNRGNKSANSSTPPSSPFVTPREVALSAVATNKNITANISTISNTNPNITTAITTTPITTTTTTTATVTTTETETNSPTTTPIPTQTTVVIASAAKPVVPQMSAAQALANTSGQVLSTSAPATQNNNNNNTSNEGFLAKTFKRLKSRSAGESDKDDKRISLPAEKNVSPPNSEESADLADEGYLPYELLARSSVKRETLDRLPKTVDISKREAYLNEEEFAKIMGVSKAEFYKMPKWKQVSKKQKAKLF